MAMPVTKRCPQPGQRQAFGGTQGQGLARRGPGTHTGWRLGELFISLTVNKELDVLSPITAGDQILGIH